ncbi:MAG: hypothetical protein IKQ61_03660 [Spirochaetales bacterium]|nr:hypothetical protein [Spirochaetales bacterium]
MCKLDKLVLERINGDSFEYKFSTGINYFKGDNGCGKTEFCKFLDYMLGSSEDLRGKDWFKELGKGILDILIDGVKYSFMRTLNREKNYIQINDEIEIIECNSEDYKIRLTAVLNNNQSTWLLLNRFANADISIRSLSAFNFLEEKDVGIGEKENFLTKCREYKYKKWVSIILDYIFNPNQDEILNLENEISKLKELKKEQEELLTKLDSLRNRINSALIHLNIHYEFTNNITKVKELSKNFMHTKPLKSNNYQTLYQFNDISERIKLIENANSDVDTFNKAAQNRIDLLRYLSKLVSKSENYKKLSEPIESLLEELNTSIGFGHYIVKNEVSDRLKKLQKKFLVNVKEEQISEKYVSIDEKFKYVSILEESISIYESEYKDINIEETIELLKEKEERLDELKTRMDGVKINEFEQNINLLYSKGNANSKLIREDMSLPNFKIEYIEKTNSLLSSIEVKTDREEKSIRNKIYRGSQARLSLIQLCGYCGINMLLKKYNNIPYLPVLVLDYISKPFDIENKKAVGDILSSFLDLIGKNNFQIIMFDCCEQEDFNINADNYQSLIIGKKTGFVPWYKPPKS